MSLRLFLCGDVMTGRGIDQVLPVPCEPHLHEHWAGSAVEYVELAERESGPIGREHDAAYPWGDGLDVLRDQRPAVRLVNLETAITTSEDAQPGKGIHYRMNPANVGCLTGAGIDCCVLANNHVLDWGPAGLDETLATLHAAGLRTAGAGRDQAEAAQPAVIEIDAGQRVLVFAFATPGSGTPEDWAARAGRGGVNFMDRLCVHSADAVAALTARHRRPGDAVVVSVHWGGNWGFGIPGEERTFAHRLVDAGGADIVWGHSSHHVKGIEVRGGKLILYGCGDLINDYEGISGHEEYRGDLSLMYFPEIDTATGALRALRMAPMRMRRFRLERAPAEGVDWLRAVLNREGRALHTGVTLDEQGLLALHA
ncbi:MAG: CapA family protein [Ramlibacter sp.]|nr:CapA family protein [Ramlibacter sp.]